MKDLYLVGAGGLGREVLSMVLDLHATIRRPLWNIKGFLDDSENPLHGKDCDYGVVGTIKEYQPAVNDVLIVCIGEPAARRRLVTFLKNRGAAFDSLIPITAYLGRHSRLGEGAILYGGFGMSVNVTVGDFAVIDNSVFGHDVTVGHFCTVSGGCRLLGGVTLGDGVFLGANVCVAPGVHIGDNAYVGLGSVVVRDVKSGEKVFGNPAREIGV